MVIKHKTFVAEIGGFSCNICGYHSPWNRYSGHTFDLCPGCLHRRGDAVAVEEPRQINADIYQGLQDLIKRELMAYDY